LLGRLQHVTTSLRKYQLDLALQKSNTVVEPGSERCYSSRENSLQGCLHIAVRWGADAR